jgi:hypothetical protein
VIIFLQYPITDIRRFLPEETGKLAKPIWPSPKPYDHFVRSFGQVMRRGKGGASGWVGENEICDAHNALKLDLRVSPFSGSRGEVRLKCAARHFFFDGLAVGKLVVVLTTLPASVQLEAGEFEQFIDHVFSIPASIHFPDGRIAKSDLYAIRGHLSKFYLYASSKTRKSDELGDKRWIIAGEPLVFCELSNEEQISPRKSLRRVDLTEEVGLTLAQQWVKKGNKRVQVLSAQRHDASTSAREKRRLLRMYLMRLHAEYDSIREITSLILGEVIKPNRGTPESEALQHYLNETTKKINRAGRKARKVSQGEELSELALATMDAISPGERNNLIDLLKQYEVRPQIINKVENLVTPPGTSIEVDKIERAEFVTVQQPYQTQTWEKVIVYLAGLLFIGLIAFLVIRNEPIADPNFVVFIRIILSILTAAMGATIPGMLNVGFNRRGFLIRASGALALFVITYLSTPTVIQ